MKYLLMFILLLSSPAFGANSKCTSEIDGSFMRFFFCPCKHRIAVKFVTPVGGAFEENQKLPVFVDGIQVGRMKLKAINGELVGKLRKNKQFKVDIGKGGVASVGNLECILK